MPAGKVKHLFGSRCPSCDEKLKAGHPDIQKFFYDVKYVYPDIHTSCVFRNERDQNEAFASGASTKEWPNSKHNKMPARAIDLFQILGDAGVAVFNTITMAQIHSLFPQLRWGGKFKFKDSVHFELQ